MIWRIKALFVYYASHFIRVIDSELSIKQRTKWSHYFFNTVEEKQNRLCLRECGFLILLNDVLLEATIKKVKHLTAVFTIPFQLDATQKALNWPK